jgi:hypothetical protein
VAGQGKNGTQAGAAWEGLAAQVAEQLWAGRTAQEIVLDLEARGMEYAVAASFVERVEDKLRRGGAL